MQAERKPTRIVIIGGGITGLAAANHLLEIEDKSGQTFEVIVLEAGSRVGGVLKTTEADGFLFEAGADSFISEKPEAIALAKRLGIESRLIETNQQHRRSFIVRSGKLSPVPEGFQLLAPTRFWPFLSTDIFSWPGKARMALDLVIPRRANDNGDNDESLASFVRRRLGREAFERMAQPMIGGIYTADPEKLSLRATLPRFLEMERTERSVIRAMWKAGREVTARGTGAPQTGVSGPRYSLFLSFDRGMQVLVDELLAHLHGRIRLNTKVESLVQNAAKTKWNLLLSDQTVLEADHVCLAIPAYAAASLLHNIDPELARLLNRIEYASTATINLAYRRADVPHLLDGFGFVVPFIENRTLLACTFSSVKFPGRAPEGHVLLRGFAGGALQPELLQLDQDDLVSRIRTDLRDLLGISKPPLCTRRQTWDRSMPQYHVGHLSLVARIRSQAQTLGGLQLAGNSFGGAGIPDCIRSGENAAAAIAGLVGAKVAE